jgi:hypothetical protein
MSERGHAKALTVSRSYARSKPNNSEGKQGRNAGCLRSVS